VLLASIDRLRALPRLAEITRTLLHFGLHDLVDSVGVHRLLDVLGPEPDAELLERPLPERGRLALEALGPTFTKFGQVLASRVDLLGPEWIASFDRLHDHAAPVAFEQVEAQLAADLGMPVAEAFAWFDRVPAAAGPSHRCIAPPCPAANRSR
jgi:ubiquinone biosynthesis protein